MRIKVITTVLGLIATSIALTLSSVSVAESNTPSGEAGGEPLVVRYPILGEHYGQTRPNYFLELLKLALDKAGSDYTLEPVVLSNFRESRSVMSVAKGVYDVHWMNTDATRETVLRPIRVPLFKGLIGWRLLMVRDGDGNRIVNMSSLEPLRALKTVQGHDWPDSDILEAHGLSVIRTPHWEGMFKMLYAGRVDYFPRSVVEVWREQTAFSELDLSVDRHVALVYPAAYYFICAQE